MTTKVFDGGGPATGVTAGQIAARLDRLPPTHVQWSYGLVTQFAWAIATNGAAYVAFLYPYLWSTDFGHTAYSWLNAIQTGVGIAIGASVGGWLADRVGRRPVLVVGAAMSGLGLIGGVLAAPHYVGLLTVILFQSLGTGAVLTIAIVHMHELLPPSHRGRISLGSQASTAVWSVLILTVGSLVVPDHWRIYVYVLGGAAIVSAVALALLPESPRWLATHGRMEEADRVTRKIEDAVSRRVGALPEPEQVSSSAAAAELAEEVEASAVGLSELFKGAELKHTILVMVAWFLGYSGIVYGFIAYQSIFMESYEFTASQFFISMAMVYGPGFGGVGILFALTNERFERRTLVLFGALIFAAAFALIWYFSYVQLSLAMQYVGWALVGAGSALWVFSMHNYTATAFSNRLRSRVTGLAFGVGHCGALFGALIVVYLGDRTADHGYYGFMLYCVVVGGLVPALLIGIFGRRLKGASLEKIVDENIS